MADHKVSVAITSSVLVFSLLGFRHVGCQQSNFRVFRTVTELREFEQLSDRERLDSALLFPATGILEITGANQAATVQEAVALNIDCLPWLRRFPGGSIQWFYIQLDEFGDILNPMAHPENPTPPGTVARITVGGEFNRWLNISQIELVGGAEDPDSKIFQCKVCIAHGTPFEQCHTANYTNRVIGGPPVITTTGINECRQDANAAMPGIGILLTEFVPCPVPNEVPRPIPPPTITWFRDGVPAASATQGENFDVNKALLIEFPILNMGVFGFSPLQVLYSGELVFTTEITNITNPMLGGLAPDVTLSEARALLFNILLANWTCVANNTLGLSSVSNFLRMCGDDDPVIPDCAAADGSRVLFLDDGDAASPGCDVCIVQGTSVMLNCMVSAGTPPISYSWIMNGVEVSQNPILTVRKPGNYSCTATSMDNAPVVEASILFFSPRATLTSRIVGRTTDGCDRLRVNDTELESIRKEIDIISCICMDETLVVECTSDDPDAQLALRSEDATMYENGTARIMVTLNNLDAANQTFMCAITSAPASCRGFLFQSRVRVYRLSPIDVSVQITTNGDMVLGQSGYSLTCGVEVTGMENPSITYQWIKNNGTRTQVGTDRVLSFSLLRLSDAGQYTCWATVSSSCNITKTDTQDITLQIPEPTVSVHSNSSNPISSGSSLTLTCTVEMQSTVNNPVTVSVEWTRPDGMTIMPSKGPEMISFTLYSSSYTLHSIELAESGEYTCSVKIEIEPEAYTSTKIIIVGEVFQLRLKSVGICQQRYNEVCHRSGQYIYSRFIKEALVEAIEHRCKCHFPITNFLNEDLFMHEDSPNLMTMIYRNILLGTHNFNSTLIVSFLQDWASSRPLIKINGNPMRVDSSCPTAISSLDEPVCGEKKECSCDNPKYSRCAQHLADNNIANCFEGCVAHNG